MTPFSTRSYITQACPACGAELILKHRFSKTVICSFCQSLLLLNKDNLNKDNLEEQGKIANLSPDMSVIQIGSQGVFQNHNFEVVGRIKMIWSEGFWNEWYVLEENGNQAWLTEAMGLYSYIYEVEYPESLLTKIQPDQYTLGEKFQLNCQLNSQLNHQLNQETYILADVKNFVLEGMEGELPFNIKQGTEGWAFDFKTHTQACAYAEISGAVTISANNFDSKDKNHRFFIGEHLSLEELQLTNLREFDDW